MEGTFIEIFTRSNKPDLYSMAADFWPQDAITHRCTGFDDWKDAAAFLWHVIDNAKDIAVVCDEDCFVTDWWEVERIVSLMRSNRQLTHAGMPDGGVSPHRCRSWIVTNPFFLVLNATRIRELLKSAWERDLINQHGYMPEMEQHRPEFLTPNFTHDNSEPFNGLFYWLARVGVPVYLQAWTHPDGISTALRGLKGGVIALHSWYSREYGHDEQHTKRINRLYEEARNISAVSQQR